jgi:uncharacterized phage protein (TIGR02218 family)
VEQLSWRNITGEHRRRSHGLVYVKTVSSGFKTHLAQPLTSLAYLWKLKRRDGTLYGFTTHDEDILYDNADSDGPITYLASSGFTNTATAGKSDLAVDNMEVTGFLDSDVLKEGDIRGGLYDDATIKIMMVNWADTTMGHMYIRVGTLGIVKMKNGLFQAEIRGLAHKLTTVIGDTYGPQCRATFGSGLNGIDMNSTWLCKIDVVALQQTGSVDSVFDARTIVPAAGLTGATGFFNQGLITFTNGILAGFGFEIKTWDGTSIELYLPMPYQPEVGDLFIIEPGCSKSLSDCFNKYNNVVNFRGEPFLPGMDRILNYPNAG